MKTYIITLITFSLLLIGSSGNAHTNFIYSENEMQLRSGSGSIHNEITSNPIHSETETIKNQGELTNEIPGRKTDADANYFSTEKKQTKAFSMDTRKRSILNASNSLTPSGDFGYTTAIGLRGGLTSGFSIKHFISSNAALEGVIGTQWGGISITGMYELHKGNAFDVSELTWVYGGGARVGFYRHRYLYNNYGNCNDPNNPKCNNYYYPNTVFTAIGIVGIGGLEYKFNEVPFTVSLDLMPYFYFNYWGRGFIDGSISARYILK